MSDIPKLLLDSLNPHTRKQAEHSLQAYSRQPAFVNHLLQLILDASNDSAVRLAASVYLKNTVRLGWLEDDEYPISPDDKESLKPQLVPAMIALSGPNEKAIRAQVVESVSLIAELDFPERWPGLIDQLVQSLSGDNFNANFGVLETAHSIFRSWRSQARSDAFWSTIKLVHSKFLGSYFQLFQLTIKRLASSDQLVAQTMVVLVELYYDLTCQDLAPEFEDGHEMFFAAESGYFMQLMEWNPPELQTDPEEPTPSIPSRIRTGVLEIAELYVQLYPEMLARSQSVGAFVKKVWELVGGGKQLGIAYDQLVSQSLRFISTAIRSGAYRDIFETRDTVQGLIAGVVVPNLALRTRDVEAFEDTPLEYVRGELQVSEISTPRQAAADVVKALSGVGSESEIATTTIVSEWISRALDEAARGGEYGWKSKDAAMYLFEAIATRSGTLAQGVTATNPNVNVVQWFADNIFGDLQAGAGGVHPVLQVDAIRYLYTFRYQLTKEQLVSVLPLLLNRLDSSDVVVYTYAAVALDRILSMRVGDSTTLMFSSADAQPFAPGLLNALLTKIEAQPSPEKVAENDFLMRCIARVIITAKQQGLGEGYADVLRRLVSILQVIARNPSNPNFDQYIFESISGLILFIGGALPDSITVFEPALFPPFTEILQGDIDQYIPYVFQILAQMLKLHRGVPVEYRALLPFLLTPAIWAQKGSIPGLVALLRAFLARDAAAMVGADQHIPVLGVVQQRLIPSKANDGWGFELLQTIILHVPLNSLQPYFRQIIVTLLTRMQQNKTNTYVYYFVYFLLYTLAINVNGLTPDYLIQTVDEIQPGLWSQIVTNFVVPQTSQLVVKDRKVAAVGLTRLLTQSTLSLKDPNVKIWPALLNQLVGLFKEPKAFAAAEDAGTGVTDIDLEEQAVGYQAAYSKLATAAAPPPDVVAYAGNVRSYVAGEVTRLFGTEPGVKMLVAQADQPQIRPFLSSLGISV